MDTHKLIRRICNVGIGVLFPCFMLGLLWFLAGSLEIEPTAEQMEKARMSAGLYMLATGIPCVVCIGFRMKYRK
ncbi:MAG: hypothetical protein IJ429_05885 [Lachnospiraceae bacterium]|nr:hypothetical protein [Lachnospiraceae bacterium]